MEVFLIYLIGIVNPLKFGLALIDIIAFTLIIHNPFYEMKGNEYLYLIIVVSFIAILAYLIPDATTCQAMLDAMKN